jgi:uncharacterized membrane protein YtjA (UPF0391 family)
MVRWTIIFLILAIAAAIFGYGDIEDTASMISQYVCLVFSALFVISLFSIEPRRR